VVAGALHIGFPFCAALPDAFRRKPLTGLHRSPRAFPMSLGAFDAAAGEWLVETNNGYLFACVGAGATIDAARADLRATFGSVQYPYMYYRADVGTRRPPQWLGWDLPSS
jgi:phosphoribosylamine-glycine ligase